MQVRGAWLTVVKALRQLRFQDFPRHRSYDYGPELGYGASRAASYQPRERSCIPSGQLDYHCSSNEILQRIRVYNLARNPVD